MTRFVLRLLLLAVLFTTGVGLPVHQAQHLARLGEAAAACRPAEDCRTSDEELHKSCEWCHAFAQALALTGPPAPAALPPCGSDGFETPTSDTLVRCARPWAFASRDPPQA